MSTECVLFIPAHEEEACISACLDAALASPLGPGFTWRKWVVYDDASADETASRARAWTQHHDCPPLEVVRREERQGKSMALNQLHLELVGGGHVDDVVIVLDADVLVEPAGMAAIVRPLGDSSVTIVWGVAVPDRRSWGRRASGFQMLMSKELAVALGRWVDRAEGKFCAYRVGPLAELRWRPGLIHDDLQLAAFVRDRDLVARSACAARVRATPARGYRDFYMQTYRYYAARRAVSAGTTKAEEPIPLRSTAVALARTARADPFGAAAYLPARLVAAVMHRTSPTSFTDAWQQARSTKVALPAPRRSSVSMLPVYARTFVGCIRAFRNWPSVVSGIVGNRMGLAAGDLRFLTRAGHHISSPGDMMARAPVLEVFARRMYHLDRLPQLSTRQPVRVLDVGAHVGAFALEVATSFPAAQVSCYEPSPHAYRYLRSNVQANNLTSRIHLHASAVGATEGHAVLYESGPGFCTNSILPIPGAGTRQVPVVSFEAAVAKAGGHVDLVKLDCEGSEYDIVLASPAHSWKGVDAVILEYHPAWGRSPGALLDRLQDLGFRMLWHEPSFDGLGMAALARDGIDIG